MTKCFYLVISCFSFVLFAANATECSAQTESVATTSSEVGLFLRGPGPFNLNTTADEIVSMAAANQWKKDLRKTEAELRDKQSREDAKVKRLFSSEKNPPNLREFRWRSEPTPADILSGHALNALLFDLTNSSFSRAEWTSKVVELKEKISVRDLPFLFVPTENSPNGSKILRQSVIALWRLEIGSEQSTAIFKQLGLETERQAIETAVKQLQTQATSNSFEQQSLNQLNQSIATLEAKIKTANFDSNLSRNEATRFFQDIKDACRMFDSTTVDYIRELLTDTQNGSPTNVGELVSFMLKYRLQFANAERSPQGLVLYQPIYLALKRQLKEFGVEDTPTVPNIPTATEPPEFETTRTGLKYRVLREGEGTKPALNETVVCHYKGWLDDQTVFDDSYSRGKPSVIRLGHVIPGWSEGLQLMTIGSIFEFEIPANLGYGQSGYGIKIPPDSKLHFVVELFNTY